MNSLRARQLISAFTIIVVSIFILGVLLVMFVSNQELENEQEDLREIGFDLMGYFNYEKGRFKVQKENSELLERFFQRNGFRESSTGMVAYLQNTNSQVVRWSSLDSNLDINKETFTKLDLTPDIYDITAAPSEKLIRRMRPSKQGSGNNRSETSEKKQQIVYAMGFKSIQGNYQLVIARAGRSIMSEPETYRMLTILFVLSAFLVLLAQLATSYWVISPIKDFEREIKRLELGEQETIVNNYPSEIKPLKCTINALLQSEVGQKRRYRDALDDLAHSLKTPLSAIQGYIEQDKITIEKKDKAFKGIANQLESMKKIVYYQLRRAVVTNQHLMVAPTSLRLVLVRLKESLLKVHHTKVFDIDIRVESDIKVRVNDEDLLELFGNLLNNACRFCEHLVEVNIQPDNSHVIVNIDDDGLGFPDSNPAKLLKRGIRADSKTEGQGIGLAVCTEIVEAAGGSIELLVSPQVGARVKIRLPM
ncbi:MAG: GHKL domain-containing protein [Thiotrichaceae bacterium]|nr:GHKL domain-containing protein [Thiotrichaceae bacterium]